MKKFSIKPPRRKIRFKYKAPIENEYINLIKNIIVSRPHQVFVSDFTYLKFQNKNIYLATVQDKFTREIVSAELSFHHDSNLILKTLQTAFKKDIPEFFHSDRGSEFTSEEVVNYLKKNNIKISLSAKASPWENATQESFYDKFKSENGDLNRFETFGEYIEEIYYYMHYYNNYRIHTALKMPPSKFLQNYLQNKSMNL
jgi:putative transposase